MYVLAVPCQWDESSRDDATYSTLLKILCEARTLEQITNALKSIPPVPEAEYVRLPTIRPKRRLIMRDGVEGGGITQSEYLIAKHASEHKIPKRVTNGIFRRYLGDGAVFSSADWCVGAVHMPSVRLRCKRMVAVLDGEPDFQGGSHL